ncbi:MAG: hypothetical protein IH618_08295 [Ignavibacteriaceae bacterium]|nr:hypothetical protein [Ignavibacteriaceae bacterium]
MVVLKGEQFIHDEEKFYSFINVVIECEYETPPDIAELEIYDEAENAIIVYAIIRQNDSLNGFNVSMVWEPSLDKYLGHPIWAKKKKRDMAEIAKAEVAHFEWDKMGYYFDFDKKNKSINVYGAKAGLLNFSYEIENFEEYYYVFKYPVENVRLGPYETLILQFNEDRFISENHIYGNKGDFKFLAKLIFNKIKESNSGDSFIIDKEYCDNNNQCLKFFVKDESFKPSIMDEIVKKRPK